MLRRKRIPHAANEIDRRNFGELLNERVGAAIDGIKTNAISLAFRNGGQRQLLESRAFNAGRVGRALAQSIGGQRPARRFRAAAG